ncbi:MAG: sulfatase-like hydrolase/transferase [Planctomycetaceae bacterium]
MALVSMAMWPIGTAADKPNIIIFLADDLGYADIGVYGCQDIPTPHVDALANNGVRFTGWLCHASGLLAIACRLDEQDVSASLRVRTQLRPERYAS